ncbi:hypothetical protein DPMN_051052 [Dreissena polymorpha]|uniref:Uncharacterized protein n=1 Tax=Dreissena polymorpha TaxID=45954 RepID=A0A9D4HLU0_DREPO|nr:hypothetical protein DPMN_051052 [Dreissena polymorpha]
MGPGCVISILKRKLSQLFGSHHWFNSPERPACKETGKRCSSFTEIVKERSFSIDSKN